MVFVVGFCVFSNVFSIELAVVQWFSVSISVFYMFSASVSQFFQWGSVPISVFFHVFSASVSLCFNFFLRRFLWFLFVVFVFVKFSLFFQWFSVSISVLFPSCLQHRVRCVSMVVRVEFCAFFFVRSPVFSIDVVVFQWFPVSSSLCFNCFQHRFPCFVHFFLCVDFCVFFSNVSVYIPRFFNFALCRFLCFSIVPSIDFVDFQLCSASISVVFQLFSACKTQKSIPKTIEQQRARC